MLRFALCFFMIIFGNIRVYFKGRIFFTLFGDRLCLYSFIMARIRFIYATLQAKTVRGEKEIFLYFRSYILEYLFSSNLKLADFEEGKVHCSYSRRRDHFCWCSLEGL